MKGLQDRISRAIIKYYLIILKSLNLTAMKTDLTILKWQKYQQCSKPKQQIFDNPKFDVSKSMSYQGRSYVFMKFSVKNSYDESVYKN